MSTDRDLPPGVSHIATPLAAIAARLPWLASATPSCAAMLLQTTTRAVEDLIAAGEIRCDRVRGVVYAHLDDVEAALAAEEGADV